MLFNFLEKKYEDIQITGVDQSRSAQPNSRPCVYLKLSQKPPARWLDLFASRQLSPMRRINASIEKDYLVVKARLDEVEERLLSELQKDIDHCNQEYRKFLS